MAGPVAPRIDDWFDGDRKPTTAFARYLESFDRHDEIEALKSDEWSWFFQDVEDKDYRLIVGTSFAKTIDEITTRSESGTCTLTGKINSTDLGGSANSISSTEQTQEHESANEMVIGDDFVLTVSGNSNAQGVAVTVKWRRNTE